MAVDPSDPTRGKLAFVVGLILIAVIISTIVVVAVASGRSNNSESPGQPDSLSSYDETPIYWVGPTYRGLPFDRAILPQREGEFGTPDPAFIMYGDCGPAFETGCEPAILIKIRWDCLVEIDDPDRIRSRTIHRSKDHLAVQAGDVLVEIYADESTREAVAQDMVVANQRAFPLGEGPGSPLPGSLCEVARFNPSPTFPATTPEPTSSDLAEQAEQATIEAVFDSFGDSTDFDRFEDAEAYLGFRLVRPSAARYTPHYICCEAGFVRFFKGDQTFEQKYEVPGRKYPVDLRQELDTNRGFDPTPYGHIETIGDWEGVLWEYRAERGFKFLSDVTATGVRVRVSVVADREVISEEDIRNFVRTLHYEGD
jgi:hypothetical protein